MLFEREELLDLLCRASNYGRRQALYLMSRRLSGLIGCWMAWPFPHSPGHSSTQTRLVAASLDFLSLRRIVTTSSMYYYMLPRQDQNEHVQQMLDQYGPTPLICRHFRSPGRRLFSFAFGSRWTTGDTVRRCAKGCQRPQRANTKPFLMRHFSSNVRTGRICIH
jgi:hypothetical protein